MSVSAGVAGSFVTTVLDGPLVLGMLVAALAGLVSFLSPCVLPLVPGYLGYVAGLSGAEASGAEATGAQATGAQATGDEGRPRGVATALRARTVTGSILFVLGFSAVFVSYGAAFGNIGARLVEYQGVIQRVMGVVLIVLGGAFLGLVPALGRQVRIPWLPRAGLAGAPALGVFFGIGWTPCVGPTLGAVQTLAYNSGAAGRGAVLSAAYALGLGLPFVLAAAGIRIGVGRFAGGGRQLMRIGGLVMIIIGVLLLGGWWDQLMIQLRIWTAGFGTVI